MTEELIQFLKHNYFIIVYGITWIVSVIYYKKYFDTPIRFFPMIIAYTFLNELLGYIIGTSKEFVFFNKYEYANDILYNIYSLIFFPYFYYIYWKLVKSLKRKKLIKFLALSFLLFFVFNCFFQNPLIQVLIFAVVFASFILVVIISIYLKEIKEFEIKWEFQKYNLMTWISFGLLSFYFFFPLIFLINFFDSYFWIKYNLGTIQKILIIIMYLLFCIGFHFSKRRAFR